MYAASSLAYVVTVGVSTHLLIHGDGAADDVVAAIYGATSGVVFLSWMFRRKH